MTRCRLLLAAVMVMVGVGVVPQTAHANVPWFFAHQLQCINTHNPPLHLCMEVTASSFRRGELDVEVLPVNWPWGSTIHEYLTITRLHPPRPAGTHAKKASGLIWTFHNLCMVSETDACEYDYHGSACAHDVYRIVARIEQTYQVWDLHSTLYVTVL